MDRAFKNEIDALVKKTDDAFSRMMWKEGLNSGFFTMQLLRDFYRWGLTRSAGDEGGIVRSSAARPVASRTCDVRWLIMAPLFASTSGFMKLAWNLVRRGDGAWCTSDAALLGRIRRSLNWCAWDERRLF